MKKIVSLLVCVMLALTALTVSAAGATVTVSTVEAEAGANVDVTVALAGNTGFANLGIEIGYDSNVLSVVSVAGNNVGATFTKAPDNTANPYNLSWDSTENVNFNGTLATITFKVADNAASGTYPVTVSYFKGRDGGYTDGYDVNYDENFDAVVLTYVNGSVTVKGSNVAVEAVALNKSALTLVEGETETLTATVSPENATDKTVVWASSNEAVATVVDGVVTAVGAGEATITATAGGKSATCAVTVEAATVEVEAVELNVTEAEMEVGGKLTLTATVTPDNATNKTVTWESSNEAVATVVDGAVTAVGAGEATITAKAGDKSATCTVKVKEPVVAVEAVELNVTEAEMEVGGKLTLTATVTPDNATDKTVTWESNNEAVATVVDGVVTAVGAGEATITAKAGNKSATCTVTVNEPVVEMPFVIDTIDVNAQTKFMCIAGTFAVNANYEGDTVADGETVVVTISYLKDGAPYMVTALDVVVENGEIVIPAQKLTTTEEEYTLGGITVSYGTTAIEAINGNLGTPVGSYR